MDNPKLIHSWSKRAIVIMVLGLCLSSPPLMAGLAYQYMAPDGSIVFTDKPLEPPFTLVKRLKLTWGEQKQVPKPRMDRSRKKENQTLYDALIADAAADNRLLPELVHAVVEAESAYDPKAVSPAGAVGLMQLMPQTAERFGVTDRADPVQSLSGGSQYLRFLLDHFNNDLTLAIAGYNAGENAVEKYGRTIPPYPETQGYVVRVLKYFRRNLAQLRGQGALTAMAEKLSPDR